MSKAYEIRNDNHSLVGKVYCLENEHVKMLEIAQKDCITQFIWPSGVKMKIINKKRPATTK